MTLRDDYWLDVGGRSVLALCRRCSWRLLALSEETARTEAEQHLILHHYTLDQAKRARELVRRRRLRLEAAGPDAILPLPLPVDRSPRRP
jgi:hypothetical protein